MPTNKPRMQTIVEPEIYEKVKNLCRKEKRSESQLIAIMIEQYIENYEKENGRITINMRDKRDNNGTINL